MTIEILDPRPDTRDVQGGIVPSRVSSLKGVPISIIHNSKPRFDIFASALVGELVERYGATPGLSFTKPGSGTAAPENWLERIRETGGVAIAGWGDCGACSTYSTVDTSELMKRRIPSVLVLSDSFTGLVSSIAASRDVPQMPRLVVPHPPTALSDQELTELAQRLAATAAGLLGVDSQKAPWAETNDRADEEAGHGSLSRSV